MIGITSYGCYIPRPRLQRKSIAQAVGWLAPSIAGLAQGEKAICNWDEDSVTLAVAAARDCLIGNDKANVDVLYLGSTTAPFADRLNSGIVAAALNLPASLHCADFTSSLRAGTAALIAGLRTLSHDEQHNVLVIGSDKRDAKPASNQEMLFGDGSAALLLGDQNVIAEFKGSYSVSHDFIDHFRSAGRRFDYQWEERWIREFGFGKIIPEAINGLLAKLGLTIDHVDKLVYPCYAKSQHQAIAKALGVSREKVQDNLHEACGETGAAHPLVMLVAALEQAKPGERIVVASFGQGCDALCFEVTEQITKLAPRNGLTGALANKKPLENYVKYLKFRNLIETDEGMRAEVPQHTALTTLWRNRQTITSLVGGRCKECGTPQFPSHDICVNEECGAVGEQEPYEFADVPATVASFTGDQLAYSVDPPTMYGIVQFEGGGRFLADFADCEMDDLRVGLPVKMSFRIHAVDRDRGFTAYFWKAVPSAEQESQRGV